MAKIANRTPYGIFSMEKGGKTVEEELGNFPETKGKQVIVVASMPSFSFKKHLVHTVFCMQVK